MPHSLHDWQIQLCDILEIWARNEGAKLLLHAPPRVGKSIIVGMRLAPWLLMHHPEWRIPLATYNIEHSTAFTETIRDLMRSELYKDWAPPQSLLEREDCSGQRFRTIARAKLRDSDYSITALGLQSGFTGKGADAFIGDDPYASPEDARSEAINERTWRFWEHQGKLRISEKAPALWMFHRYHEDDIAGRLKASEKWTEARFAAIADENEDGSDPTGRDVGEVLSPLWSLGHYLAIKQEDPQTFLSMYQGRPRPAEGDFIKRDWLKTIPINEIPAVGVWVRFWDLATKADQKGDRTAGALVGVGPDHTIYVKDLVSFRAEWPEAMATIAAVTEADLQLCELLGARYAVGVEKVAWQRPMIADLFKLAIFADKRVQLWPVPPLGDKKERASGWVARARFDKFRMGLNSSWNQHFINICIAFDPPITPDDEVDAVSGGYALVWDLQGNKPYEPEKTPSNTSLAYIEELARESRERAGDFGDKRLVLTDGGWDGGWNRHARDDD